MRSILFTHVVDTSFVVFIIKNQLKFSIYLFEQLEIWISSCITVPSVGKISCLDCILGTLLSQIVLNRVSYHLARAYVFYNT